MGTVKCTTATLPDGTRFTLPAGHNRTTSTLDPTRRKSPLDLFTLFTLLLQVGLFFTFRDQPKFRKNAFLVLFAFWRISYNAGLGTVLKKQSETRAITKYARDSRWFEPAHATTWVTAWLKRETKAILGQGYEPESTNLEYNTWLVFRHIVDLILINDFLSYTLFCLASYIAYVPVHNQSNALLHHLRFISGYIILLANIYIKVDAHRVIKDYAWYWGDCFFASSEKLVFDGIFKINAHPMYQIGYLWYYGMSLLTWNREVLVLSILAHLCQYGFLKYFEDPHIARTYNS